MLHVNGDCPVRNIPLKHHSSEQWASPLALLAPVSISSSTAGFSEHLLQHCSLLWAFPQHCLLQSASPQHYLLHWASLPTQLTPVSIFPSTARFSDQWASPLALLTSVSISFSTARSSEHLHQHCLLQWASPPGLLASVSISTSTAHFCEHLPSTARFSEHLPSTACFIEHLSLPSQLTPVSIEHIPQHCSLQWPVSISPSAAHFSEHLPSTACFSEHLHQHCLLQWVSPPALLAPVSISTSTACSSEHLHQRCLPQWASSPAVSAPGHPVEDRQALGSAPDGEAVRCDLAALRRQQLLQEELMFQSNYDDCRRRSVTEQPHWNKYPRWMCRSMK